MELVDVTIDLRVWVAVFMGLLCFGWAYDRWVAGLESKGHDRGYTAFLVVIGCAVTIVGFVVVVWSLWLGLILLSCFAASGPFMIVGSIRRHVQARAEDEAEAKKQIKGSFGE